MYELLDEAIAALAPRSTVGETSSGEPSLWSLSRLDALRVAGVTHVKFRNANSDGAETVSDLTSDFSQLIDALPNNSRVLMDFAGLEQFCQSSIESLELFKRKLQSKGSQIALCSLEPDVRAAFFPARN